MHARAHTRTSLPHPLLPQDFFPPESVLGSALRFSVGALFPTPASRVVLSASWERKIPHFFFFYFFAAPGLTFGTQDLVPWPGIKSRPPALGAWSLNHWTAREVPQFLTIFNKQSRLALPQVQCMNLPNQKHQSATTPT